MTDERSELIVSDCSELIDKVGRWLDVVIATAEISRLLEKDAKDFRRELVRLSKRHEHVARRSQ